VSASEVLAPVFVGLSRAMLDGDTSAIVPFANRLEELGRPLAKWIRGRKRLYKLDRRNTGAVIGTGTTERCADK
jgi:hypothetical protein